MQPGGCAGWAGWGHKASPCEAGHTDRVQVSHLGAEKGVSLAVSRHMVMGVFAQRKPE